MSSSYSLFSTEACHLCEMAEQLLLAAQVNFVKVDIVDDDELMARYGVRIPVLRNVLNDEELAWPFDEKSLADWLALN